MNSIFHRTNAYWAKYSEYEYRQGCGHLYLMPAPGAKPAVYDPIKDTEALVVGAINIGRLAMKQDASEEALKDTVMEIP